MIRRARWMLCGLMLFCGAARAQVLTDADAAFRASQSNGKPVLLVFSGSDWCAPCIRLERDVLSQKVFQEFADRTVLVLEADFPQRKKLSDTLVQQNESLAARYNPAGAFPFLVLLRPDRSVMKTLRCENQTPEGLVEEIRRTIDYEKAQGVQTTD